jgi:hypothetical protein
MIHLREKYKKKTITNFDIGLPDNMYEGMPERLKPGNEDQLE